LIINTCKNNKFGHFGHVAIEVRASADKQALQLKLTAERRAESAADQALDLAMKTQQISHKNSQVKLYIDYSNFKLIMS
jgi:hypothetical protein